MTQYEIYIFILCAIVFFMLTTLSIVAITYIAKLSIKLIRVGAEDDKITAEDKKTKEKKLNKTSKFFDYALSFFLCIVFALVFSASLYINCAENTYIAGVPTYRVVKTASMSEKHKKNEYLVENNLNDQIQTFDLILTYAIPKEEDLKLYDIVVYEVDNILIVHRIVGIEEPNVHHPNERYFLLQGDNVESPDRFPVRYSQMRAIYRGEKIPFVGSFVLFMQSPAGWLCMLLVVVAMVATPLLERKFGKEKALRLQIIVDKQTEEIALANFIEIENSVEQTELIEEENNGVQEPKEVENGSKLPNFESFNKVKTLSFHEKLDIVPELVKQRYNNLTEKLESIDGVRSISGKEAKTFKKGNQPIVRFAIRGKTLNAFVALEPEKYKDTKYVFTDVSSVKKLKNYPMRVKVTSDRQERYLVELVNKVLQEEKGE